jgi:cob(I)alamin adenosyltransferase
MDGKQAPQPDGLSVSAKPVRKGLTLVYTGDGKGKTTAAVGIAVRAAGRGMNVLFLQFIKSPRRRYGEAVALDALGVEIIQTGVGFTWTRTPAEHRDALAKAWALAKEKVMNGGYDMVVLDELNNALAIDRFPVDDVLPLQEVLDLIDHRPPHLHLIITGRNARREIIDRADLVSEIRALKHYYQEGVPAVPGLEY